MQLHYLHEREKLLCTMHPSFVYLIPSLLRGIVEIVSVAALILVLLAASLWFIGEITLPMWLIVVVVVCCSALIVWRRVSLWRHASLRITTDRILVQLPGSLIAGPTTTIKWSQYQESQVTLSPLTFLAGVRNFSIRYGSADAEKMIDFPAIYYGQDLKHYIDKVDSLLRQGATEDIRPFVAKPRGKRG